MSSDLGYQDDEFHQQARAAIEFMQNAHQMSDVNGACVLESWTCPHCHQQQRTAHFFRETLKCGACGKTCASRVPRLPQPGEVTKDQLIEAIRLVRSIYPEMTAETREWIGKHEGAVRAIATALACDEARRALGRVEDIARQMSGGHHAP